MRRQRERAALEKCPAVGGETARPRPLWRIVGPGRARSLGGGVASLLAVHAAAGNRVHVFERFRLVLPAAAARHFLRAADATW